MRPFLKRVNHNAVRVTLTPTNAAVDEPVHLSIRGLKPNELSTIVAETTRNEVKLSSFAIYKTDERGSIDLTKNAALQGGSFQGIEPMGLFWSGQLTSELKIPFRMLNGSNLDKWSYVFKIYDYNFSDLDEALKTQRDPIACQTVERLFLPDGVRRVAVHFGKVRGVLFLPSASLGNKFPAIIDIFGGAHGLVAYRGGLFARHGFACLSLAYAAYEDLPRKLEVVDFDYFNEAYKFLACHPNVHQNKIGAFGSCLGGTIACMLARCQPEIRAVAAVSPEAFAGTFEYRLKDADSGRYYNIIGARRDLTLIQKTNSDEVFDIKPCFARNRDYSNSSLNYDLIKCPLLFMYGSDDKFFDLDLVLPTIARQLSAKSNAEVVLFPGAGHIIQPAFMPMFSKYYSPYFQKQIFFGGSLPQHAKAQEVMWNKTLAFFKDQLA